LFDPCWEEAQEAVQVRAHTNRSLPPSRRRVATASHDEDAASFDSVEEANPFQRIQVATMQTKMQNILLFDAVLQQRQMSYQEGEQDRAISYE
jgi:hypothetical protein